jgi:hypothetical protein
MPKPAKPKPTESHGVQPAKPMETAAAKPKPPVQHEANAAAAPAGNGMMSGAQPVVPAGNFDSRWGGLQ